MTHHHHFTEGRDRVLLRVPERVKRAGIFAMGLSWIAMSWSYLGYINTDIKLWRPELVSIAFSCAGVAVLVFFFLPWSWRAYMAAAVSTMTAWCLRATSIVVNALSDDKPYKQNIVTSQTIGLFWLIMFLWIFWQLLVLPWHKEQRAYYQERKRRGIE